MTKWKKRRKQLIFWFLILGLISLAGRLLVREAKSDTETPEAPQGAVLEPKSSVLDDVLAKLAYCESRNNPLAVGDGGLARGTLQFHENTFVGFAVKYGLYPYAEKEEIKNFYLDSEEQVRLAKLILTRENEGWRHWKTCSEKIGLDKMTLK